jgi:hypothetical protein
MMVARVLAMISCQTKKAECACWCDGPFKTSVAGAKQGHPASHYPHTSHTDLRPISLPGYAHGPRTVLAPCMGATFITNAQVGLAVSFVSILADLDLSLHHQHYHETLISS